jgi:cardiolipin synthase
MTTKPRRSLRHIAVALALMVLAGCGANPVTPAGTALSGPSIRAVEMAQRIRQSVQRPVTTNNRLSLTVNREVLPAFLDHLRSARHSLYMQAFEFWSDALGRRICDILIDRHKAGVDVRVILDQTGQNHVNSKVERILRQAGVAVQVYRATPYVRKSGVGLKITHRKLYLVDGDKAMTGGMNLGERYLDHAHDILWRVDDDAAWIMHDEFRLDWVRPGGRAFDLPLRPHGSYGQEHVGIAVTSPRERGRESENRKVLFEAIDKAVTRIDRAYPFFSDDALMIRLKAAAKRGVQVRVILTKHDREILRKLNKWSAKQIRPAGVQMHWYDRAYAHIKYTVIDDAFLLVGSSNGDTLTFENNQELGLILTEPSRVSSFRAQVPDPDRATTPEITDADLHFPWYDKPLAGFLELIDYYMLGGTGVRRGAWFAPRPSGALVAREDALLLEHAGHLLQGTETQLDDEMPEQQAGRFVLRHGGLELFGIEQPLADKQLAESQVTILLFELLLELRKGEVAQSEQDLAQAKIRLLGLLAQRMLELLAADDALAQQNLTQAFA